MKKLCVLTAISSFMMLLATAGASDLNIIGMGEIIIRVAFCLAGLLLSIKGIEYYEAKEEKQRKARRVRAQAKQRVEGKYSQVA